MILVTGGAGFVGNNTIRRLLKDGHAVRAQVRDLEKAQTRLGDLRGQVEVVKADIGDRDGLRIVVARCVVEPGRGIDTPADLEAARAAWREQGADTGERLR